MYNLCIYNNFLGNEKFVFYTRLFFFYFRILPFTVPADGNFTEEEPPAAPPIGKLVFLHNFVQNNNFLLDF